jgi:hypothetical protein
MSDDQSSSSQEEETSSSEEEDEEEEETQPLSSSSSSSPAATDEEVEEEVEPMPIASSSSSSSSPSPCYSWNGPLLAGMYNLPHHEACFSQDADACREYAEIISDCLATLLVSEYIYNLFLSTTSLPSDQYDFLKNALRACVYQSSVLTLKICFVLYIFLYMVLLL